MDPTDPRRAKPLSSMGDHPPGERRVSPRRPGSWTIEWDGHEGLAYEAYASHFRSPYLQNVTTDAVTILWRVSPPEDTAALARPLVALTPDVPFALRMSTAGYLEYAEREVGINLGWSPQPRVQWEVRGDHGALEGGKAVALWNRAASDYLVHSRRGRGVDLCWLTDTRKRNPAEWRLEGSPPGMRLSNLRKGRQAHLLYGERRYGVNLVWGARPDELNLTLDRLQLEATLWLVAYFHDHNCGIHAPGRSPYPRLLLQHGVDLALMGHRHHFEAHDLVDGDRHLRSLVVGTGGYGDPDPGDHCRRPGFVLLDFEGDSLRYWKYDTHRCAPHEPEDPHRVGGTPLGRDAHHWHIREYCYLRKTGLSAHEILDERDLNEPV